METVGKSLDCEAKTFKDWQQASYAPRQGVEKLVGRWGWQRNIVQDCRGDNHCTNSYHNKASKGPNWRMLNLSVYDKTWFAYLDCCDLGTEVYTTVWGIVIGNIPVT